MCCNWHSSQQFGRNAKRCSTPTHVTCLNISRELTADVTGLQYLNSEWLRIQINNYSMKLSWNQTNQPLQQSPPTFAPWESEEMTSQRRHTESMSCLAHSLPSTSYHKCKYQNIKSWLHLILMGLKLCLSSYGKRVECESLTMKYWE